MGYPMAGHLARAGHQVKVYNRAPAKGAQDAEIILLCVGRDEDVRAVINGKQGVTESLSAGTIIVDHSTTSAQLARVMAAELKQRGVAFIDAPVSGGQAGAQNGQLTIFCGGESDAFQRAAPVLACYARAVTHLGAAGSGQLAKMVNQICIAGLLQRLAEGIHFGMQAGAGYAQGDCRAQQGRSAILADGKSRPEHDDRRPLRLWLCRGLVVKGLGLLSE